MIPSGFKSLVKVNDSEMNETLGWCVVLALFHVIYYYTAWLRL